MKNFSLIAVVVASMFLAACSKHQDGEKQPEPGSFGLRGGGDVVNGGK